MKQTDKTTKELRIVFTKSKKKMEVGSWLIRWWTKKEYSHVARAIQIRDWGYRFFQASEGKVNYEFEEYFHKKHEIVIEYKLAISAEVDKRIKYECYIEAGKKYGTLQNVGIFLVDIGLLKDTPWKEGRNCSELMYLECLKILIPHLDYNSDTIKPHHIEDIIVNYFYQKDDGLWYLKND